MARKLRVGFVGLGRVHLISMCAATSIIRRRRLRRSATPTPTFLRVSSSSWMFIGQLLDTLPQSAWRSTNYWRSQGDSNPCFRRERATSWAARRWERRCLRLWRLVYRRQAG